MRKSRFESKTGTKQIWVPQKLSSASVLKPELCFGYATCSLSICIDIHQYIVWVGIKCTCSPILPISPMFCSSLLSPRDTPWRVYTIDVRSHISYITSSSSYSMTVQCTSAWATSTLCVILERGTCLKAPDVNNGVDWLKVHRKILHSVDLNSWNHRFFIIEYCFIKMAKNYEHISKKRIC